MADMASVRAVQDDITTVAVDAVVNAANSSLMGRGGVDGAIHRAGGPAILEACQAIRARDGRLPTGDAVATTAGDLPARIVIHTVGPVWQGGGEGEAALLASCYRRSLEVAMAEGAGSVAFPAISTGVYGYPIGPATRIAVDTVRAVLAEGVDLDVVFVCFSAADLAEYQAVLDEGSGG